MRTIIDRLKLVLGGQCLSHSLTPDGEGQVPCLIIEGRKTGGACDCTGNARQPVSQEHQGAVAVAVADPVNPGWDCLCEILQLTGEELKACQNVPTEPVMASGKQVHGWCHIDAMTMPPTGNPEIVKSCPPTERRVIRFLGEGAPAAGATAFIGCVY
ncbi:MAG: hypothetical protein HY744_20105 [Deltaproteobacteria bacterium]|nr:hypothetical protein [Deltaproteobacteria bacterium]